MFRAQYLENGWRLRVGYNGTPIGNPIWGIKWSATLALNRGFSGLANLTVVAKFVSDRPPLPW